ncbi:MAG: hypothetical protein KF764_23245 [Labilithrix sp.]|nr:hypothetical protein [Labilithrix sp.]MBX3222579.1 hypothetical protein [Labilithrix sp.]
MKRPAAVFLVAAGCLLALVSSTGCSSSLAQPFEGMKSQPVTVHRLLDFEQPAAQAGAAPGGIQLPPQIQQWLNGAGALLPPGLIPPGLLPGTTPPPAENVQRFYNFRIVGTTSVTDNKTREEILELFGKESNFQNPRQSCMYAEFGFQIGQPMPGGTVQGAPNPNAPADILVSLSCETVQMFNHGWPYGTKTGLTPEASQKIHAIVRKTFGG